MNNTMDNIKQMILEDSHRWQCPKYRGVVVVHPDMVEDVISMICVEHSEKIETYNLRGVPEVRGSAEVRKWRK